MDEYNDLAIGLIEAVKQAGDDTSTAVEAINAAIQREVNAGKQHLREMMILAVNDTSEEELNHSSVRLLINHVQ